MGMLAFWMPGPWELAILSCVAMAVLALIGSLVVIAVVLATRSFSRQAPASPPEEAAPPREPHPPDAGASA